MLIKMLTLLSNESSRMRNSYHQSPVPEVTNGIDEDLSIIDRRSQVRGATIES